MATNKMKSTATSQLQPIYPKLKNVTVFPKITFDADDVPELLGQSTGYICKLCIKVRKVNEGIEEYSDDNKNKIRVEVLGVMSDDENEEDDAETGKDESRKHEKSETKKKELKEVMAERRSQAGY